VGELRLEALVPDLVAAFPRFLDGLPRADPGCAAKTAIVEALRRLGHDDRLLYRQGAAHVQMEPVFGGRVDTAVDLRGASALALAETEVGDVLVDLANLLADPEPPVRISAARAVSVHGRGTGIPLLHLKALAGDPEPRVVSECLLALLRIDAPDETRFVASFLEKGDEAAEAAAVALGESRCRGAAGSPRVAGRPADEPHGRRFAIAAPGGTTVDVLLAVAQNDEPPATRDALAALASIASDASLYERARAAVAGRPGLNDALARAFGRPEKGVRS
jgi:HEAT repeat protein